MIIKRISRALPGLLVLLMLAPTVFAQETSSAIRGVVTDSAGNPVSGATVVVANQNIGLTRTVQTDSAGAYNIRNLPIDTGYTVTATGSGYGGERAEAVSVNLGRTATVNFGLAASTVEEVEVIGTPRQEFQVALGPSSTFGIEQLENAPAINRNITDVVRADPRLYVDESRGDINAIQCAGKNSRFNSLTVDGVRMNDSFGLNSNGYPTERMPFSYDAINQVAVELAPFDVEYGGFSACNINAVTKSGGNEFSGSAFFDYTSDSLRGDELEGDKIETGSFSENRYGFTLGGPIIKDKVYFFAAYEKLDGVNLFDRGPIGSGAVNEVAVTQAELDEIAQISRDVYLFDPGPIPSSLDHEDEKLLVKFDWNVNDSHRAAFTYNFNDGENFTQSDGDQNEFEFQNHLYERGAELTSYVGTLYSDWNSNFSTEIRVGYLELDNRQLSVGGTDFGEIRVILEDRVGLDDIDVYLGGDDSRSANKLKYDVMNFALKGNYFLDNGHLLTFGFENEALEVFNLFVQQAETEIRFEGIDDFRDGLAERIEYNSAPSNNVNDAAAVWGYDLNTVYAQDEFSPADRWTVVAGVRYDWYTTDDAPLENPDFLASYGFSNSTNLDGEGLIQPRVGFTYDYSDNVVFRGGIGQYTGGNPNVWLSNNFSANNVLQFGARERPFDLFDPGVVYEAVEANAPAGAGPGWGVPQVLFDAVATGSGRNFEINFLDPNFELPSELKFALGMTLQTNNEYTLSADFLYTDTKDSAIVQRADLEQVGTDFRGYPIYNSTREPAFVLTNSGQSAESKTVSFGLSKDYPDAGFDWTAGYTFNDATEVQPMTSSVAFSNYTNRAFFDPQEDVVSVSNYNIRHRVTLAGNWRTTFANNLDLTVSLFGSTNSGRPFSRTIEAFDIYTIPSGFDLFLDGDLVLPPGRARNDLEGSWWGKIDARINLDFPGFMDGHRGSAFMVIDNLTNLLNDDWGVLKQNNFPRTVPLGQQESRIGDASRYEIRFGFSYDF